MQICVAGVTGGTDRDAPSCARSEAAAATSRRPWIGGADEQPACVFQYWIDAFLISIIPYVVSIPFDRSSRTSLHIIGGIIAFVLFIAIGFWYWVIRPRSHNGQTFAMQWFGLRVISKDGGPANTAQYFIRWVSLIVDAFPWVWPLTGLFGLIVMVCSRFRQRTGDHLGRTQVISDRMTAGQPSQFYDRTGPPIS